MSLPALADLKSCWRARSRRGLAAGLSAVMTLGALGALGSGLPAQAQVRLPSLGESASDDLSVGAERRIGDSIMREARRDPEFLDDPVLQAYLESLFAPLVLAARQMGNIDAETDRVFAWEPFLLKDRSVNAFAMPGGFVGVHLGLIAITSTPDQLASVLAHELTHVTQRHIARSIAPSSRASMLAIATMILGIIAASKSNNPDVLNAAVMGGQGAAIQSQLNFSRDMEREADRIGYGLMGTAGYATSGMAAMFERLDVAMRLNDSGGFPYLRSHPLTTDRISESRNRTLLDPGLPSRPTLMHAMMQMRSRVLMAEGVQALRRLAGSATSPLRAERVVTLYGGALAASMLNEHVSAAAQVSEALQLEATLTPPEPEAERALRLLQAEVRLTAGQPLAALVALDALPLPAPARTPNPGPADDPVESVAPRDGASRIDRPALLLRAQAVLAARERKGSLAAGAAVAPAAATPQDLALRDSTETLQTWLADHPQDAAAWDLLARTSDALGLRLRSMRAAAEARAMLGDYTGAIDRLRAAQGSSRAAAGQDFIEASVIDARLRQLTAQRRRLALEARGDGRADRPEETPPQ
jgi:predicted Zn-dependent protease